MTASWICSFVAGSNIDLVFVPITQSYDYDAPISEGGQPIKSAISVLLLDVYIHFGNFHQNALYIRFFFFSSFFLLLFQSRRPNRQIHENPPTSEPGNTTAKLSCQNPLSTLLFLISFDTLFSVQEYIVVFVIICMVYFSKWMIEVFFWWIFSKIVCFAQYGPPPGPVPPARPKSAYGKFHLHYTGSIFDNLARLSPNPITSALPLTFEPLKQAYGFVLYRTTIPMNTLDPSTLYIDGLHDRAIVFLDAKPIGLFSRVTNITTMDVYAEAGQTLDFLVQNEGRICSGTLINELKGILGNVSIDGFPLTNWTMFPIGLPGFPVQNPSPFGFPRRKIHSEAQMQRPGFYSTEFTVDVAQDTFLRLDGWRHGYVFVNGRNLGRYWPVQGPQVKPLNITLNQSINQSI